MILLPLPRRVGPTAEPLFSPRRTWRRRRLQTDRFCRGLADLPRAAGAEPPAARIVATVGSDGGRSGRADNDAAGRAMARPSARSRGRRSARHAGRSRGVHVRPGDDAAGRPVRGRPTACRSGPCQGYDAPARIVTLGQGFMRCVLAIRLRCTMFPPTRDMSNCRHPVAPLRAAFLLISQAAHRRTEVSWPGSRGSLQRLLCETGYESVAAPSGSRCILTSTSTYAH